MTQYGAAYTKRTPWTLPRACHLKWIILWPKRVNHYQICLFSQALMTVTKMIVLYIIIIPFLLYMHVILVTINYSENCAGIHFEKEIPAHTKNSHYDGACHSVFQHFHCFYNVAVVIVCKHPCKNVYGITFLKSTFCQTSTELSFHGLMDVNWWAEEVRLTVTHLLFKL